MITKRLAKLESVLARPVEQPPPDMAPVRAQLAFLQAGVDLSGDVARLHKGKTSLQRFATALRVTPMRLWKLTATADRRKFRALYGRLKPLRPADRAEWNPEYLAAEDKRRAQEADDVADHVVREFLIAGFRWEVSVDGVAGVITLPGARRAV